VVETSFAGVSLEVLNLGSWGQRCYYNILESVNLRVIRDQLNNVGESNNKNMFI